MNATFLPRLQRFVGDAPTHGCHQLTRCQACANEVSSLETKRTLLHELAQFRLDLLPFGRSHVVGVDTDHPRDERNRVVDTFEHRDPAFVFRIEQNVP